MKKIMKLSGWEATRNTYDEHPPPESSSERFRYRNLLNFTLAFANHITPRIFKLQKKQFSGNAILSFHVGGR
jgi:hypothetical protein